MPWSRRPVRSPRNPRPGIRFPHLQRQHRAARLCQHRSLPAVDQGRTGPQDLVNSWKTFTIGGSTYFKLKPGHWNSWPVASGRYSVLLTAEDTTGVTYHDIQHIWLDNHNVIADIVEFQWKNPDTNAWEKIPPCTPLSLNVHGQIRIVGLAWDPLIDEAWWTLPGPPDGRMTTSVITRCTTRSSSRAGRTWSST